MNKIIHFVCFCFILVIGIDTLAQNKKVWETDNFLPNPNPGQDIVEPTTIVVRPIEINDVLTNPGIGFTTFQRFNGDKWEGYQDCLDHPTLTDYERLPELLKTGGYPLSSLAYFRIRWRFIEPEMGKIRFDFIDRALKTAHDRGQTLMLRIAPYTHYGSDLPEWIINLLKKDGGYDEKEGRLDPDDINYVKYFTKLIRALGNQYDGHPYLESVDVSIVGSAGEGMGTNLLKQETREKLVKAYKESFKKTQLIILCRTDKRKQNVYWDFDNKNVGWRLDCLGDLRNGTNSNWNHMWDYYPQAINQGMQNVWRKEPIVFEACWNMKHWKEKDWDIDYIIDQSLKWHISSFNNKSMKIPDGCWPQVEQWLNKMGYRFVLRKFTYPSIIKSGEKLSFTSWWENKGVAPCYKKYSFAIRLSNQRKSKVMITDAKITNWLPGDVLYDDAVFIPGDLPAGNYELQIGIVDKQTHKPKINLAIKGKNSDGWYFMGDIEIQ